MGDRVLLQVVHGEDFGPVVYGHWSGADTREIVRRLAGRMEAQNRGGDLGYASARLVQEVTAGNPKGALGVGMWNAKEKLTAEDTHGDAGVVLIDCANGFRCECLGGYLRVGDDGFPVQRVVA